MEVSALRRICFWIALCLPLFGWGQGGALRFDRLGVREGLSNNTVFDFAESESGYVWIGTNDGLNGFDGKTCKKYKINPGGDWSGGRVINLEVTEGEIVWAVVSGRGLWRGNPSGKFVRQVWLDSLDLGFGAMRADTLGNLWLVGRNGLCRFPAGGHSPEIINTEVAGDKLALDNAGGIWGSRDSRVWRLDLATDSVRYFSSLKNLGGRIRGLALSGDSVLWVGLNGVGVAKVDVRKDRLLRLFSRSNGDFHNDEVQSLTVDARGRLWVGNSTNGGLYYLSGDEMIPVRHRPGYDYSVSNDGVYVIRPMRNGDIWAGTYGGGTNHLNLSKNRFGHFRFSGGEADPVRNNTARSAFEDSQGHLWLGTKKGVTRITADGQVLESFAVPELRQPVVLSVGEDSDGCFWFGTFRGGLHRWNPVTRSIKNFYKGEGDSGFPGTNVYSIFNDSENRLWIGSIGEKLARYDKESGKFVTYPVHNIGTVTEDSSGDVWFGGYGQIFRLRKNSDKIELVLDGSKGLGGTWIHSMTENMNGGIAFTMEGHGFYVYKDGKLRNINKKQGLPSDLVYGVEVDRSGNYWVATSAGLTCLDSALAVRRTFREGDGLPTNEFTYNASLATRSGRMLFGSQNGFAYFSPDSVLAGLRLPAVTSVRVLDGGTEYALPLGDTLRLTAGAGRLSWSVSDFLSESGRQSFCVFSKNGKADTLQTVTDGYLDFSGLEPGLYSVGIYTGRGGEFAQASFSLIVPGAGGVSVWLWVSGGVLSVVVFLFFWNKKKNRKVDPVPAEHEEEKQEPKVLDWEDSVLKKRLDKILGDRLSDLEFNVEALARELGMSRPVLYRKVKAGAGCSVKAYWQDFRLGKAAEFLKNGDAGVSQVAEAVGFGDAKHFSVVFKAKFGVSPGKYRDSFAGHKVDGQKA
ncbi:hypothetical protein FUAX_25890 [Fulvitalea axinellae]|uniref:HTH araC/xylS-type domain-containing protein n=1 Tax=Fulvitalea axinellae TaxID=1182444 RepID=A0AAU9CT26_9BACT|nr:hypothetical protein FUAX_25890 [Fulvitalea axinellae]